MIVALYTLVGVLAGVPVIRGGDLATTTDLYIVSMLPYPAQEGTHPIWQPTWMDGPDIAPVVYLAVEQINNRTDLLSNYTLHVIESDGACNIGTRLGHTPVLCRRSMTHQRQGTLWESLGPLVQNQHLP